MELISICAWCQPDTSATNTTHGICETHAESMINLYLLRKNLAAPALNTSAANKRAHHEEEETPLQILPHESIKYISRKDHDFVVSYHNQYYGIRIEQHATEKELWEASAKTFPKGKTFHFLIWREAGMTPIYYSDFNKHPHIKAYCPIIGTIIENEIAADYANARFEAARYR